MFAVHVVVVGAHTGQHWHAFWGGRLGANGEEEERAEEGEEEGGRHGHGGSWEGGAE